METEIFNKLSPMNQRHSGTREPVTCPESGRSEWSARSLVLDELTGGFVTLLVGGGGDVDACR